MTTTDIKHSLEAVAGNLASIQQLAASARQLYQQSNTVSSPRTPQLPIQTGFSYTHGEFLSTQTLKQVAKKTSSSSMESGGRGLSRLTTNEQITSRADSGHDLPTLLDLITSKYNQQIGVLVSSIDHLTKRLSSAKCQNRLLKKSLHTQDRQHSRRKSKLTEPSSGLQLPILPGFGKTNESATLPQPRRRKNSSLIIFKAPPKKPDPLRKVKASPLVSSHYDKFKKKLNQLNSNALTDYL